MDFAVGLTAWRLLEPFRRTKRHDLKASKSNGPGTRPLPNTSVDKVLMEQNACSVANGSGRLVVAGDEYTEVCCSCIGAEWLIRIKKSPLTVSEYPAEHRCSDRSGCKKNVSRARNIVRGTNGPCLDVGEEGVRWTRLSQAEPRSLLPCLERTSSKPLLTSVFELHHHPTSSCASRWEDRWSGGNSSNDRPVLDDVKRDCVRQHKLRPGKMFNAPTFL